MPAWWGTREVASWRLQVEYKAMRAAFGDTFKLIVPQLGQPIFWRGMVEINMRGVFPREHVMKILYPHEYPVRAAEAYIESPRIYSEKHQFEDGQLCLFNPKDGTEYGWNPSSSTAVTVAGWAINWIYAYYTWRATEEWPGSQEHVR